MEWLDYIFYENKLSDWLLAIGAVVGSVVGGRLLYWFISRFLNQLAKKTTTKLDDVLVEQLREPLIFCIVLSGMWLGIKQLHTKDQWEVFIRQGFFLGIMFNITWLLVRVLDTAIKFILLPLIHRSQSNFADTKLPIIISMINVGIWTTACVFALNYVGYNVQAVLAGLGIGGLAFAVAANYTLSNVIGGITIIFVQPFKVGDRIRIEGHDGFVEEIGLSVCRIRTFVDETLVVIPNRHFTDKILVNMSLSPARRTTLKVPLPYSTSPRQIEEAVLVLKQIALNHPHVADHCKVAFDSLGQYALQLQFMYYIHHDADLWDTQTEVTLEVFRRFGEAGIEFAYLRGWLPGHNDDLPAPPATQGAG
jgi:MscS family membrane protein